VAIDVTTGRSTFHLVSAASTNLTNVKASAGRVFTVQVTNTNAAARKLAFHNTAGTPTAGASVLWSVVVPATSQITVAVHAGVLFTTGIGISTVTETADSGTTAVGAGDLNINVFYE
jgi:hypothetical protein